MLEIKKIENNLQKLFKDDQISLEFTENRIVLSYEGEEMTNWIYDLLDKEDSYLEIAYHSIVLIQNNKELLNGNSIMISLKLAYEFANKKFTDLYNEKYKSTKGNNTMKISKIRNVKSPSRGTEGSAGIDFYVPNDYPTNLCSIQPGDRFFIPSGIKANVPEGYALIAFNKSGVALKKGLMVGACVVDHDYEGEIHIHLVNTSDKIAHIEPGEKLVQFLLVPVDHCSLEEVEERDLFAGKFSTRGSGGFGSTGII